MKKQNFLIALAFLTICGCSTSPVESPSIIETEDIRLAEERRVQAEELQRKRAEEAARRKAEQAEAKAKEARKQQRIKEYEERKARERAERIAAAQQRELEKQEQHRQSVAKNQGESLTTEIVTARFDHALKNNLLGKETERIRNESENHNGIVIGGFRLGMDIQDAYLLARVLFKDVSLQPDFYRGSLRIRIGAPKTVDMSDSLEGAFVAGLFGDDASFVFAQANSGTRQVDSFRFTAEMVKNLLELKGPISNDQLARIVFRKLGLDWEYNFEYEVYSFISSEEAFHGYSKATKLSNSLTVVNPGDFTLNR